MVETNVHEKRPLGPFFMRTLFTTNKNQSSADPSLAGASEFAHYTVTHSTSVTSLTFIFAHCKERFGATGNS